MFSRDVSRVVFDILDNKKSRIEKNSAPPHLSFYNISSVIEADEVLGLRPNGRSLIVAILALEEDLFRHIFETNPKMLDEVDSEALYCAVCLNQYDIFKFLIKSGVNPGIDSRRLLSAATSIRSTAILEDLMRDSRVDLSDWHRFGLVCAIFTKRMDVVRILLSDPRVDPTASNGHSIESAANTGQVDMVEVLAATGHFSEAVVLKARRDVMNHPSNKK